MTEHQDPQDPKEPESPKAVPEAAGPGSNGSASVARQKGAAKRPWRTTRVPPRAATRGTGRTAPASRRWVLIAAAALFILLFGVVFVRGLNSGPKLPPRTVEDQEFVRQANASCARSLPDLRRDRARRRTGDENKEAALAGTVDRTSDELARLTAEVRGLPVSDGDQAEVRRWLDDWDAYVVTGRRFADSLRRSDNKSYAGISAESNELSERIFGFSKANGISECVF